MLIEYRILRRVLIEQVESSLGRRTTPAEDVALSMGIDTVLQQGVVSFVKHQSERLRAANQAEAKYLSFLSHDLRGQLNGIALVMELVKRRLATEPGFEEEVSDIQRLQSSVNATVEGMQRLLQAERLRQQTAEPKSRPVNLNAMASEVAMEFSNLAQRKGVKLAVDVPLDAVVHSDRDWLQIILQNLVSSAVKYSALSVCNEGPGIPPEHLASIFQAFRRGDTHG